jgi:RNA recognition motif-containing protein
MKRDIFVGNLPLKTTEQQLQQAFCPFGTIVKCEIIYQQVAGRARKFAFIKFTKKSKVEEAVQAMNGHVFGSRNIHVDFAHPKGQRPRRPLNLASFTPIRFRRIPGAQKPQPQPKPSPVLTPEYECKKCGARVHDLYQHIEAYHTGRHPPKRGNQVVGRLCPCGNPVVPGDDRCYSCMSS